MQTVSYTRGNDLSGPLEGAGGIGGMLARSHGYSGSTGNWSTHNYYHADAGGNITCLINAGQSITASYRYDPFGRTLFQSGTMASANVYRFSSKEVHGFTGVYCYGFRFYDPGLQRWINRDPIGEMGGVNLYGFVFNDPLNAIDPFGLSDTSIHAACRNPHSAREVGKELLEEVAQDRAAKEARRRAQQAAVGRLRGDVHHAISKRVANELNRHPTLKGKYKPRDNRFRARAKDKPAHDGYDAWQRKCEEQITNWLKDHPKATPKQFEGYLRRRYSMPDAVERFPMGPDWLLPGI